MEYALACQLIAGCQRPMLVGHVSPDGDTIGSALALAMGLKTLGKTPQVILDDDLPDHLFFLPELNTIKRGADVIAPVDLVIMVDCAAKDRGGAWLLPYLEACPSLIIDHHAIGDVSGTVELIDAAAAATGELVYQLLAELHIQISQPMAVCLYAALVSDTGGFRFNNTTPRTLAIGSALLGMGVDLQEISINLFQRRTKKNAYLYGRVLMNLAQSPDEAISWSYLDLKTVAEVQGNTGDCVNMSNAPMLLPGTLVGAIFEERPGEVKLSFRSRRGYDVGAMAGELGGGGHALAAGATVKGSLEQVMADVLVRLRRVVEQGGVS